MAIWDQDWIKGRFGERSISDRPPRDPDAEGQDELKKRMAKYPEWKNMFSGRYLEEEIAGATQDPESNVKNYRWPARVNLFRSYSLLHAGMVWGRGESSREADDLFDLHLEKSIPGIGGKEMKEAVPRLQDILHYWWSFNQHLLRPSAAVQQWAGGSILKLSWNPFHPNATYGVVLESVQPEHFYPVWDPIQYDTLLAAKIVFRVPKTVAIEKYGMLPAQIREAADGETVRITEYWSRTQYFVMVGEDEWEKVARIRSIAGFPSDELAGPNPWKDPNTQQGMIPVFYTPRIRTDGFFGDSLMEELKGPITELNKALADIGDALNSATHISGVIADNHAAGARLEQEQTLPLPQGELLNLGLTPTGRTQGRYWPVKAPDVPNATPQYLEQLREFSDMVALLTKAARGDSKGGSGFGVMMEMLPTLYIMDWMRSHWATTIAGRSGINRTLGIMLFNKAKAGLTVVPQGILPRSLMVRQNVKYRAMVPRDQVAKIQEIAQLATNKILPPRKLMERLGDVENIDEVLGELYEHMMWVAAWDAAVAGRTVEIGKDPAGENEEQPSMPLPEVQGEPEERVKQPATQAQQTAEKGRSESK